MKAIVPATALAALLAAAGCNTVPSRSEMYRAAGAALGERAEQHSVMFCPYYLTGAEQGWPVEVITLADYKTYDPHYDSHRIIRMREDGLWEIVWVQDTPGALPR
ncbi:MAG TPA: hypothetical protein PLZ73_08955 [bacterium]|nr:hypothetical protein [bacterium]